jgi:hypothetical protein
MGGSKPLLADFNRPAPAGASQRTVNESYVDPDRNHHPCGLRNRSLRPKRKDLHVAVLRPSRPADLHTHLLLICGRHILIALLFAAMIWLAIHAPNMPG